MAAIDMIVENPEKFNSKKSAFANIIFDDMNPYCKFLVINYYFKAPNICTKRFIYILLFFVWVLIRVLLFSVQTGKQDEEIVKEKETKIIEKGQKMSKSGNAEGIYN